jgi:hypothetical protein
MVLFQDAVRQAVNEFRSGPALRILLALPDILDWRVWRRLDQQKFADQLGLARSQVTSCLIDLLERGYIERRGKRSQYEWRLLPKLGWRGSVRQYHQAVGALRDEREPSLPLGPVKVAESILWKLTEPRGHPQKSASPVVTQPVPDHVHKRKPAIRIRADRTLKPLLLGHHISRRPRDHDDREAQRNPVQQLDPGRRCHGSANTMPSCPGSIPAGRFSTSHR